MTTPQSDHSPEKAVISWYITTDWLENGGHKMAGPFKSKDEALAYRTKYESKFPGNTYFVDSEEIPNV